MGGTGGLGRLTSAGGRALTSAVGRALDPVAAGGGVVLGVSGGPDSIALAHLVRAARPDLGATVACVRHGLRDDRADVAVARAAAAALRLRFVAVDVRVGHGGAGPEAAAREARYAALVQVARSAGVVWVLVGHTADDQAETVLLNLARGSGLDGLAGMPAERQLSDGVRLCRPLLGLRRADVRAVPAAVGLAVAADPSNDDPDQRRARARHRLLPLLAELTGGGSDPVAALARAASHARRDAETLTALAEAEARRLIAAWGPVRCLPRAALDALGAGLATRVLRILVGSVGPVPDTEAVAALLAMGPGGARTLRGGVVACSGGGWLAVAPGGTAALPTRTVAAMHGPVTALPELRLALHRGAPASWPILPPWAPPSATPTVPAPQGPIMVRARRPGDRITTAGGTRTVADAMIDAGVPRVARRLVPVIADPSGPLWVPGVAVRAGLRGADVLSLSEEIGYAAVSPQRRRSGDVTSATEER